MSEQSPAKDAKGRFVSGNIGGGRPKGSRNLLAEMFWSDLHDAWKAKGKQAIDDMIRDKPGDFVKVVASQMPKEFLMKSANLDDVSDDELADIIATIRALASAGHHQPARNGNGGTPRAGPAGEQLN